MADVVVRLRPDGVRQIVRSSAPLESGERRLFLFTILFAAAGYFLADSMPAEVLAAVAGLCALGEILGLAESLALRLKPAAEVVDLPVGGARRR